MQPKVGNFFQVDQSGGSPLEGQDKMQEERDNIQVKNSKAELLADEQAQVVIEGAADRIQLQETIQRQLVG